MKNGRRYLVAMKEVTD